MITALQHNQKRQLGIPMTTIKPKQQEEGKRRGKKESSERKNKNGAYNVREMLIKST